MDNKKEYNNTWIIILLVLIILGLVGYICYDKLSTNKKDDNSAVEQVSLALSSKEAFNLIKDKITATDIYPWNITSAEVLYKSNNTYLVNYTDFHNDGYNEEASSIFEYKNGKWEFSLPGVTGWTDDEFNEYHFEKIKSEKYIELYDILAKKLIENELNVKNINHWTPIDVKVTYKGDNNYYLVSFTEHNADGYDQPGLSCVIYFKNNGWVFDNDYFAVSGFEKEDYDRFNFSPIE